MNSEDFSCSICEEAYDAAARLPRVLPCGHTYCHDCLKLLSAKNFICPEDRSPIRVKSPDDLPKNFALLKLLQTPESPQKSCRRHDRALEYICLADRQRLCRLCVPFHSGHDVKNEKETLQEIRSSMDLLHQTLEAVTELLQSGKGERQISKLKEALAMKRFEVKAKLKDEFEEMRRRIAELEEEEAYKLSQAIEQLDTDIVAADELQASMSEISNSWIERSKTAISSFSSCQQDIFAEATAFESGCIKNLLGLGKQLHDELDRLNSTELVMLDRRVQDLGWSRAHFVDKKEEIFQPFNPVPDKIPIEPKRSPSSDFNDSIFKEAMSALAFKTSERVDFSGAGCIGDRGVEIASHLAGHPTLRSLNLVRNKLTKKSLVSIFQALESNSVLVNLNISQNVLSHEALHALLELLRANSTLKEVSLRGNCRIPYEYKAKLGQFNTGQRRVNFN